MMGRGQRTNTIECRDFTPADADTVATLWHNSWASTGLEQFNDPTVDEYRERLEREDWSVRLACVGANVVGFIAFRRDQGWVGQLFVKPSAQRAGVGTALLNLARREMPGGFWLRTDLNNAVARRFYESRGLRLRAEEVHPGHGHLVAVYAWP